MSSIAVPLKHSRSSFFFTMGIMALVMVLAGFSSTYIIPMANGTYSAFPIYHVHGAIFLGWILLTIVQPYLVKSDNVALHRKVGKLGGYYAIVVFIMGVVISFVTAYRDIGLGKEQEAKSFFIIPLTDMVVFALFVSMAILKRHDRESHKRLILLANVSILPAALGRLSNAMGVTSIPVIILILESFIIVGVVYDLVIRRRIHSVYLWGGAVMVFVHVGRFAVMNSVAWRKIADAMLD